MKDLQEHIGLVLSITGGLLALLGTLAGVIWRDLKKSINKFPEWMEETTCAGGVVTRDDHFKFCKDMRDKCPISNIENWKSEMEKGGIMMREEHIILCDKNADKMVKAFMIELNHHRELMMAQLTTLQATVKVDIMDGITSMKNEIMRQIRINGEK